MVGVPTLHFNNPQVQAEVQAVEKIWFDTEEINHFKVLNRRLQYINLYYYLENRNFMNRNFMNVVIYE